MCHCYIATDGWNKVPASRMMSHRYMLTLPAYRISDPDVYGQLVLGERWGRDRNEL